MDAAEVALVMLGIVLSMNENNQKIFAKMVHHYVNESPDWIPELSKVVRDAAKTKVGDTIADTDYVLERFETDAAPGT